jgi:alkylated DNA repair dioxygenase AlkB
MLLCNHPAARMPVPGLMQLDSWIDATTEAALVAVIDSSPWRSDLQRRVQHYGWQYDYKARRVSRSARLGPLPAWAASLARRIAREGLSDCEPDQVIVNEYVPGQGISKHIDCVPCFGPTVLSLSLVSPSQMTLSRRGTTVDLALQPRSLLVLRGPARSEWAHAIPARRTDVFDGVRISRGRRLSLTFRTIRREALSDVGE